jgi:hypothetical protein
MMKFAITRKRIKSYGSAAAYVIVNSFIIRILPYWRDRVNCELVSGFVDGFEPSFLYLVSFDYVIITAINAS